MQLYENSIATLSERRQDIDLDDHGDHRDIRGMSIVYAFARELVQS